MVFVESIAHFYSFIISTKQNEVAREKINSDINTMHILYTVTVNTTHINRLLFFFLLLQIFMPTCFNVQILCVFFSFLFVFTFCAKCIFMYFYRWHFFSLRHYLKQTERKRSMKAVFVWLYQRTSFSFVRQ